MKFQEILENLLKELENHPDLSAEEILRKKVRELNLSQEDIKEIVDANEYISEFDKTVTEIEEARENGIERQEYLNQRVEKALSELTEQKRSIFIESLSNSGEEMIDDIIKEQESEHISESK